MSPSNKILTGLIQFLASSYALYLKNQNFHWNVTGPEFITLHKFFEQQYEELAEAIDVIAEQIRVLNSKVPAGLIEFAKLSKIKDTSNTKSNTKSVTNGNEMITELLSDHLIITNLIKNLITVTNEIADYAIQDLLIARLRSHEKTIWILRQLSSR